MPSIETVLRGERGSLKLYCSLADGYCFVSGIPVSIGLFSKLFHLSEGYLSEFRFRGTPRLTVDGESVPESLFRAVHETATNLARREAAVFRAEKTIHIPHPSRPSAREEVAEWAGLPPGSRVLPRPSALRCLGHWYLSTPQRRAVVRVRANVAEARQEVLSWFVPLEDWLESSYRGATMTRESIQLASRLAILHAVISYPEQQLRHPDPGVPLHAWMDRQSEVCLRRILHIGPWRDRYVRERQEVIVYRAQRRAAPLQPRHTHRPEPRPFGTDKLEHAGTGSPLGPSSPAPIVVPAAAHNDMPLKQLLSKAKAGDLEAMGEVCTRFAPLARKLASCYCDPTLRQDLEQEAQVAVYSALHEYDPANGTFAWLVERRMRDAMRAATKGTPYAVEEYSEEYHDGNDEHPIGAAARIAQLAHRCWELETGEWGGGGIWYGADKDLRVAMLEALGPDEQVLLGRLYGLPGYSKATQQELAVELGMRQQAVSKRAKKAIDKLERADWWRIYWQNVEQDPLDYW